MKVKATKIYPSFIVSNYRIKKTQPISFCSSYIPIAQLMGYPSNEKFIKNQVKIEQRYNKKAT